MFVSIKFKARTCTTRKYKGWKQVIGFVTIKFKARTSTNRNYDLLVSHHVLMRLMEEVLH
jgi:hypothetical protein